MGETRARRTHARRSCDLCKLRKTRCELPDLDIVASPNSLPEEKSCHRCRVLMLPCVVNDTYMKKRKKRTGSGSGISAAAGPPPNPNPFTSRSSVPSSAHRHRTTSRTSAGETSPGTMSPVSKRSCSRPSSVNPVDDIVDISAAFPLTSPPGALTLEPSPNDRLATRTVRMHGRPLTLLGAMVNVAARKLTQNFPRRLVMVDDLNIEYLVTPVMRSRLEGGYAQLVTFHPHLQPLHVLFTLNRENPGDISTQLLLASAVYIALQSLFDDPDARHVRDTLAPSIVHWVNLVLVQQPTSFHALQALELLALHAPFAPVLPFQIGDPRTVAPSRGLIGVAKNISEQLNFDALFNVPIERWDNPDFWLWLGMRVAEGQVALEDERPRKPVLLAEARLASAAMINPDNETLWTSSMGMEDPAELLGKLTICDRLARLDELYGYIVRLRGVLENSSSIVNFDGTAAVLEEFQFVSQRITAIDQRHNDVFALIALPQSLASGWLRYRSIHRRWESMKTCLGAFQTLVALHFLPGSIYAVPNLPQHLNTAQAVHYALNRSNDPGDILYAYSTNTHAAEEIRRCTHVRGELAEQQLVSFNDLSQNLFPTNGGLADIVPLHDVMAMVLESAKALMEQQASMTTYRSLYTTPVPKTMPTWAPLLRQASQVLRRLSLWTDPNEGTSGENIASGCSSLLNSMFNTLQDWMRGPEQRTLSRTYQREQSTPTATRSVSPLPPPGAPRRASTVGDLPLSLEPHLLGPPNPMSQPGWLGTDAQQQQPPLTGPDMVRAVPAHYTPSPSIIPAPAPQQQLEISAMELTPPTAPAVTPTLSGRVERISPESTPFSTAPQAPATATAIATQNLDHLLSEMFGYGYAPSPSQQSALPAVGPGSVFALAPTATGHMASAAGPVVPQLIPGPSQSNHSPQQQPQQQSQPQQQQQQPSIIMPPQQDVLPQ